ncbi:hypothetical protein WJX81_001871 [Elliptochloris bilobata]|uniref:Proline dehydrogenase n=1 Tax=Elliptochloris bilobata TaxID=381761 RepID=A0AAW1S0C1_9CHLO
MLEPHPEPRRRTPRCLPLDFGDPAAAFGAKSTRELLLAWSVFSACQIKPLVRNADALLRWSKRLLPSALVDGIVKRTFFAHFCGGETQESMRPVLNRLHENGIGSILDYAAEDDVESADGPASRGAPHGRSVARTYLYETERACDAHLGTFLTSIEAAGKAPGQGFAAIKVTALGNTKLLERVSSGLVAIRNLFSQFDINKDNVIEREEFASVYSELFTDATPERLEGLFKYLDKDDVGVVDFLSWSRGLRLHDVPQIIKACRAPGPLALSALSTEELALLEAMMNRLARCAKAAFEANVRLMVDAEHSYFQPAIDHAATELQRTYNRHKPTVLNTYQCYLQDSHDRLQLDMQRARSEDWRFGAKLVRGAYMYLERDRAAKKGYPSPIWPTIEQTHANYDRCVEQLIRAVTSQGCEVMIASHNQASIERAVALLEELDMDPGEHGVYFGQLLGMADPLTYVLGRNGYRGYKYVPFGRVGEVLPYLIRRAQENSTVLGGVAQEKALVAILRLNDRLSSSRKERLLGGTPVRCATAGGVRRVGLVFRIVKNTSAVDGGFLVLVMNFLKSTEAPLLGLQRGQVALSMESEWVASQNIKGPHLV